uniref:Uncharacterized protein n=1 Tax=Anguilla anguilla TaxID=7936 RepID=A0A0E9SWY6_ANGAN
MVSLERLLCKCYASENMVHDVYRLIFFVI